MPLDPDLSFLKAIKLHLNRQNDIVEPAAKIIELKASSTVQKKNLLYHKNYRIRIFKM